MHINAISFRAEQPSVKNKTKSAESNKKTKKDLWAEAGIKRPYISPWLTGGASAILWFGLGYFTDKLLIKFMKKPIPPEAMSKRNKLSLGFNICLGLGSGIWDFYKTDKENKKRGLKKQPVSAIFDAIEEADALKAKSE